MIFALFLAGLIAVMLFAPDTDAARWLHHSTVQEPLDLFARRNRPTRPEGGKPAANDDDPWPVPMAA